MIYLMSIIGFATLATIVILFMVISVIIKACINWVNDDRYGEVIPNFLKGVAKKCGVSDGSDFVLMSMIGFGIACVLSWVWPLVMLFGIIYLSLYTLRGFIRFKKKIDKALANKSDIGHSHQSD